jgi:hypothetical protein
MKRKFKGEEDSKGRRKFKGEASEASNYFAFFVGRSIGSMPRPGRQRKVGRAICPMPGGGYYWAMSTVTEIEAAAARLPADEQRNLLQWLAAFVGKSSSTSPLRHSVLDIPPVSLGGIIDLKGADDDILGEMLEDRI